MIDAYCTSGNSPTNAGRDKVHSKSHGASRDGAGPSNLRAQTPPPDVLVIPDGSVVLFQLLTDAAQAFVSENVQLESWQWLGNSAFACDPRFAPELVRGMVESGLAVSR